MAFGDFNSGGTGLNLNVDLNTFAANRIGLRSGNNQLELTTSSIANIWYFITASIKSTSGSNNASGYLDGKYIGDFGYVQSTGGDGTVSIGRSGALNANYFNGQIDDIRIYNRALSAQEVNQLYVGGRGYGLRQQRSRTTKKTIYIDTPVPAKPKPTVDTAQKLKQGLVGAWIPSLGATGNRLEDKSPYRNHGTLTNMDAATCWKASGGLGALDFDGVNDYVALPSKTELQPAAGQRFSISAWINPAANVNQSIIGHGRLNGYSFYVQGNFLEFAKAGVANTGSSVSQTPIGIGSWSHVVVTNLVNSSVQLYINGVLKRNVAFAYSYAYTNELRIGDSANEPGFAWNGKLDDIRVWNRLLTAQEIQALYQGGRGYGFRPQRTRYELGTVSVTGGFQSSRFRRRPMFLGSGILQ